MNDTGTPTLRVRLYLGPTSTLVILDSTAVALVTITGGGCNWDYDGDFVVTALGASGVVRGQRDRFNYNTFNGSTQNSFSFVPSNVTTDTTGSNVFNFTVQWGAASASNTITLENYELDFTY